jgi:hypothetical protein
MSSGMWNRLRLVVIASALAAASGCAPVASGSQAATFGTFARFGTGNAFASYFADSATHTCWLEYGTAFSPLDCCHLALVPEVATAVPWLTEDCPAPAETPSIQKPPPAPPPAP